MSPALLAILRCPRTGQALHLESAEYEGERVRSGWLVSSDGEHRYPIHRCIPRFVGQSNYADNFGMQWNLFRQTQLDSHSGHSISADRFWKATGWQPGELAGQAVLDVGCGAGRFAEVALNAGARVVAVDYSSAADACRDNLKHHPRLEVIQADIYSLPLPKRTFPFVYSLGVLQHTPDVARAFAALPPMLAPRGRLCVDFYEKTFKAMLLPKFWLRPITKRVDKQRLFSALKVAVPPLLSLSRGLGRVPGAGSMLKRVVPVANYEGILPLDERQHLEWSLLDTFDWLAPEFDSPQTASTVRAWLEAAGLAEVEILRVGHLVGRGTMPDAPGH